ncbi:hypothetical protein GCM10023161_45070 [Mycobacterium paraffinicum]|uniref:Uncharacterized protein n=1 Tax=Mycobacterium paraffinicum TaxID=53378 RepID=A0ABP8F4P0_9MYCO
MRYMRVPGSPKGQGTNRDAVNPARRAYPTPTPRPATYNSPTTPGGARRSHSSRTNNAAVATGPPIGAAPDPAASGRLIDAYTVASVGP